MKYLLILALTVFQFGYGQGGGGGQRGGGQRGVQSGQNRPPQNSNKEKKTFEAVNINDSAGLFTYDPKVVIKETKVKKAADKELITQLITEYNKEISKIEKVNKVKLETIELISRAKQKEAIEKNDHKQLMEIRKNINKELHPIRMEIMVAEKALNSKIEVSFSKKINKKWSKYFEKQKKQPKENENNPDFNSGQNNQSQQMQ